MKRKKSASGSPSLDLKRFEIAALITLLLLLVSPLFTSAQTVDELQAQIQALLARVAALQGQMVGTSTPTQPPHPGDSDDYPTPTSIPSCPNLSITMQRGSRDATTGGQVTELQVFLANHFDLDEEDVVSGYFGKLTQQFVTKFQNKYGLPAFGIAGSLTRAKIASVCGGGPVVIPQLPTCMVQALRTACPTGQHYESAGPDTIDSNGCRFANLKCVSDSTSTATFSASPTYGAAPLAVQFTATNLDTASNTYTLDYGDGSQISIGGCGNNAPCFNYHKGSHTYTSAGTYTATLTKQPTYSCPPGGYCPMLYPAPVTVGTATITVVDNTTNGPKLVPQSDTAGDIGAPVTIIGMGFTPGNTNNVYFGSPSATGRMLAGANLAPTNIGGNFQTLFFTVPISIPVGTHPVSVTNSNGSSGTNDTNGNPVTYNVTVSSPKISSISPSPAPVGSTITISGKGFDQQLVNVDILSPSGQEMQVSGATPTDNGTQVSIVLNAATVPTGQYLVSVRNVGPGTPFGGVASRAAPLTVTGSETRPTSITVVSPNGGGYYSKGEPMHVQWTTTNIRFDSQMLIRLRSVGSGQEYNLTTTLNDGFERVDLSSIPTGSYTLEIKTAVNGQSYLDASDSYFKIVESTPLVSITVDGQTTLTVQDGTYYTLAWSSKNVTSCTMYYARSNGVEPVTSSNSVVANTSDQTRMSAIVAYTLTCQSASGPVSQTATVFKTASQNPTFSAWPNSGTAPLTSHLTISGASSASGYSVNFGDGSSDYNWKADTETANTYFMSHTFQTAGTYTAALMYQPPSVPCSAPPGAACMMVMPTPVQVGTATITVAAQNCDAVSGCSYKVDPSTYPTQGVGGTSASSGANANLASALSALESALNELIRMFSTL